MRAALPLLQSPEIVLEYRDSARLRAISYGIDQHHALTPLDLAGELQQIGAADDNFHATIAHQGLRDPAAHSFIAHQRISEPDDQNRLHRFRTR